MSNDNKMFAVRLDREQLVSLLRSHINTREIILGVADDGKNAVCVIQTVPVTADEPENFAQTGPVEFLDAGPLQVEMIVGEQKLDG